MQLELSIASIDEQLKLNKASKQLQTKVHLLKSQSCELEVDLSKFKKQDLAQLAALKQFSQDCIQ